MKTWKEQESSYFNEGGGSFFFFPAYCALICPDKTINLSESINIAKTADKAQDELPNTTRLSVLIIGHGKILVSGKPASPVVHTHASCFVSYTSHISLLIRSKFITLHTS